MIRRERWHLDPRWGVVALTAGLISCTAALSGCGTKTAPIVEGGKSFEGVEEKPRVTEAVTPKGESVDRFADQKKARAEAAAAAKKKK